MDIDYNKLKFFLAVVRCGGVTAAASELHRTQSAVSQAVAAFERSLGVKLILWEGKSMKLTREGKRLFQAAEGRMLAIEEQLVSIKMQEHEVAGCVELGLLQDYSTNMHERVFEKIATFRKSYPQVTFKIHFATSAEIEQALLDQELDMGFLINIREPNRFCLREIATEQHLIVTAAAAAPLSSVQEVLARDLIDIDDSYTCFTPWVLHHAPDAFQALVAKPPALIVPNFLSMRQLVLAGQAVAVLPRYLIEEELANGKLVQVLPSLTPLRVWVSLAIERSRQMRLCETLFQDHFQ